MEEVARTVASYRSGQRHLKLVPTTIKYVFDRLSRSVAIFTSKPMSYHLLRFLVDHEQSTTRLSTCCHRSIVTTNQIVSQGHQSISCIDIGKSSEMWLFSVE